MKYSHLLVEICDIIGTEGVCSMSEVKCKKCGCEIEVGMKYCPNCGEKKKENFLNSKKNLDYFWNNINSDYIYYSDNNL